MIFGRVGKWAIPQHTAILAGQTMIDQYTIFSQTVFLGGLCQAGLLSQRRDGTFSGWMGSLHSGNLTWTIAISRIWGFPQMGLPKMDGLVQGKSH